MATTLQMVWDIIARDGASATFRKVGDEAEASATRTDAASAKMGAAFKRIGEGSALLTVAFAAVSIKMAADFESAMARTQTMAGASAKELKTLSQGILDLAPKVGTGPEVLAESLYHVESAGFHYAKAMDMVAASSKLAKIGQDDINSSTQAVVATMASNIKGVRDANDAAALILHTVGTGDMTMHQFTQALGTGILATASAVGLSFRDIGAAIATLTDNAIPADQAATKLRTSLLMMVNPSGPAAAALNSIGLASTALAMDLNKPDGLKVAFDDIRAHLDHAFPKNQGAVLSIGAQKAAVNSYRDTLITTGVAGKELDKMVAKYTVSLQHGTSNTVLQEQAFAKMFGGSKNAGTMMVLFNEQLDRMNPKLASYGDATSRAAEMQKAWAKQQDTFKQKLDDVRAGLDVFLIKAGNVFLPVVKRIVDFIAGHMAVFQDLAYAIGTVLVAATLAWFATLALNPISLFVEAIVGIGLAVYKLSDPFVHWGKLVKDTVGEAKKVWHEFTDGFNAEGWTASLKGSEGKFFDFGQRIHTAIHGIQNDWHGLLQGFHNPDETVNLTGTSAVFERFGQSVKRVFRDSHSEWMDFRAGWAHPDGQFDNGIQGRDKLFADLGRHIHNAFTDITDGAKTVWHWFQDSLLPVLDTAWHMFQDKVWPVLVKVAKAIGKDLVDAAKDTWKMLQDHKQDLQDIGLLFGGIGAAILKLLPVLGPLLKLAFTVIIGLVGTLIHDIGWLIRTFAEMTIAALRMSAGGLTAFKALNDGLFEMAHGILRGLVWVAEGLDAVFGGHHASAVRRAMQGMDDLKSNFDQTVQNMINGAEKMANGIQDQLNKLDHKNITMTIQANGHFQVFNDGSGVTAAGTHFRAAGGPIFGGVAGRDSVPAMLMPGEHVWTTAEVQAAGGHGAMFAMRSAVRGFADGGPVGRFVDNASGSIMSGIRSFLATAEQAVAQVGKAALAQAAAAATAGNTPISYGGGANTIGLIEALANTLGVGGLSVTSTYRPNAGYHGIMEAVDFSNGPGYGPGSETPGELAFNRAWAAKYGSSLAELIHAGAGSVNIKDGKVVDGWGFYGAETMMGHFNHVHVAISPASLARAGAHPHAFASGGMPQVGRPYWTGENGPELQVALGPTRVFSHEDSKAMTRGGVTIAGDLHVHGDTDLDLLAQRIDFLQRAGGF